MHFRFYFVQNIWQNLPSQMQISYVDNNEIVKPCISYFPKSYFNISELNYTNTNLHLFQMFQTTQTSSNTTAWTLDKYGTNAHDAFFYVEVSWSPPTFEVFFCQIEPHWRFSLIVLMKLQQSKLQRADLYNTAVSSSNYIQLHIN